MIKRSEFLRTWSFIGFALWCSVVCFAPNLVSQEQIRTPEAAESAAAPGLSVPDLIALTRIGSDTFGSDEHVLSPDGSKVASVIQKGDLAHNARGFSLLVFHITELLGNPKPDIVVHFSTSSNRPGIAHVAWLSNDVIAFIAESPGAIAQVYTLKLSSRHLIQRTHAAQAVTAFKAINGGATVIYSTEVSTEHTGAFGSLRMHGFVVPPDISLSDVIAGRWGRIASPNSPQGFVYRQDYGKVRAIALPDEQRFGHCMLDGNFAPFADHNFLVGPSGNFVLLRCLPKSIPTAWTRLRKELTGWWIVLDLQTGATRPLTGGPSRQWDLMPKWTDDSRAVVLVDDYPAPEGAAPANGSEDAEKLLTAEVEVRTGSAKILPEAPKTVTQTPIVLQEGPTQPWQLATMDPHTKKWQVIYDPNPTLAINYRLAKVTLVNWTTTSGAQLTAGLYWPNDYRQGQRYPLLIQTHGFRADKFAPDGLSTTGYAAQPLAAAGVMVAQAFSCVEECESPKHKALSEGQQAQEALEGLIDRLDQLGLIDRQKVALQGYSRSCYHELYFLTHSDYSIAAMTCTDGVDVSYLQYLLFAPSEPEIATEFEAHNGGAPFGPTLRSWMERAPGFNLDRVHTPIQLTGLTDVATLLEEWEPFAGLILQGKPAELKFIPDAVHNIVKPWERFASQQGAVDWFRFWLQGYERTVPVIEVEETLQSLNEQYMRWHGLRERQQASTTH
jgi:hypothetical protein